jgi:orotidine-5'-phosphate decarboxylase
MITPMAGATFLDKLALSAEAHASWLCVGLDPDPALAPPALLRDHPDDWVVRFLRGVIEATSDLVCCYKPNLAFFEALGRGGLDALRDTLDGVPPGIPTLADGKRADIGNTSRLYARALFDELGFDAATVNPYLGGDSLAPFFEVPGKGVFVLVRTSNAGAAELQELPVRAPDGRERPLYQVVAERALGWDRHGTLGLVVGATAPEAVAGVRRLAPAAPILLPGVGAQAGDLEAAVGAATDERGERALVNASRGILYAGAGADWQAAARRAAAELRAAIEAARRREPSAAGPSRG